MQSGPLFPTPKGSKPNSGIISTPATQRSEAQTELSSLKTTPIGGGEGGSVKQAPGSVGNTIINPAPAPTPGASRNSSVRTALEEISAVGDSDQTAIPGSDRRRNSAEQKPSDDDSEVHSVGSGDGDEKGDDELETATPYIKPGKQMYPDEDLYDAYAIPQKRKFYKRTSFWVCCIICFLIIVVVGLCIGGYFLFIKKSPDSPKTKPPIHHTVPKGVPTAASTLTPNPPTSSVIKDTVGPQIIDDAIRSGSLTKTILKVDDGSEQIVTGVIVNLDENAARKSRESAGGKEAHRVRHRLR